MWIEFHCGNCGKSLDSWHESHDSGEFFLDKTNLDCPNCENYLVKIIFHRG